MAIYLYSGSPGSGKSLHAAMEILAQCRRGLPAVVNFSINPEALRGKGKVCVFEDVPSPGICVDFSRWYFQDKRIKEGQILLVLDECGLLFNSRNWKNNLEWVRFFSQHRKYGYDVIMIAQSDVMIDKQIRPLIEYNCVHRNISRSPGLSRYWLPLVMGRFRCVSYWYQVPKMKPESYPVHYSKEALALYDTFQSWD